MKLQILVALSCIIAIAPAEPEPQFGGGFGGGQFGGFGQQQQQQPPPPWAQQAPQRQPQRLTPVQQTPTRSATTVYITRYNSPTAQPTTQAPWWQQPQQAPPNTLPESWGARTSRFGPKPGTLSTPSVLTIPTSSQRPREPVPFVTVCAGKKYVEDDVSNALTSGCFYMKKNQKVGKTDYPRVFNNDQRFDFGIIQGPYYEFPLITSAGFVAGDPGPDRVIFNGDCKLAGEVTLTNAGYRGYSECQEEF